MNTYVNIVGLKFGAFGIEVIGEANRSNMHDASEYAETNNSDGAIWIMLPCECRLQSQSKHLTESILQIQTKK